MDTPFRISQDAYIRREPSKVALTLPLGPGVTGAGGPFTAVL
jgi:hypothetical protein